MPHSLPTPGSAGSRTAAPLFLLLLVLGFGGNACKPQEPIAIARALQEEGRYEESLEPLREVLDASPDDPEAHFLYGSALRRTGQPSLSLWSLRKASREPGWEVPAGLELATSAFQSHNYPLAVEETTRVLEIEPENTQALRLRAEAHLADRGQVELAIADLEQLLEKDPENLELRVSRVIAFLMLKRVDEAEKALEEINELAESAHLGEGTRAQYCVARATFTKERGDRPGAEKLYEECLEEFPEDDLVLAEAIVFFDEQGESERATDLVRAQVERKPDSVELLDVLARRLRATGDVAGAEAALLAGTRVESPPLAAFAWRALADHYIALGENAKAVPAFEKALALEDDPPQQIELAFADLLIAAGQRERAREVAAGFEQDSFRDLIEARILLEERRPEEAIERFENAVRVWPDNAAARYYMARAAESIGDFDRAVEEYRQSIRAGAEFTDAGKRLAELHEAEGAYRLALGAAAHQSKAHGETTETRLRELRLRTRTGEVRRAREILKQLHQPMEWARAMAFSADLAAERRGAEGAVKLLRDDPRLDFTNPRDAEALRSLVKHLLAAGRGDEALAAVDAALAAHPDAGVFHEIRGFALAARGAPSDAVRAAYERAVALDAEDARALTGLARIADEAGDATRALELYDRAAAADPSDPTPVRAAAEALARSGQTDRAIARLEDLLWDHPYDAAAARRLAEWLVARDGENSRTAKLLQRAKRFGPRPAAPAPPADDPAPPATSG